MFESWWQNINPTFPLVVFFFLFLTDFFAKRRRTTETKSALSPFLTSSSEAAQCKTIRWSCQKTEKRLFVSLHTVLWTKATHCTKWASCYVMLCYSVLFYFILFYFIASFTPLSVIYFIYDVLFNFSAGFIVLFIFALFFFFISVSITVMWERSISRLNAFFCFCVRFESLCPVNYWSCFFCMVKHCIVLVVLNWVADQKSL